MGVLQDQAKLKDNKENRNEEIGNKSKQEVTKDNETQFSNNVESLPQVDVSSFKTEKGENEEKNGEKSVSNAIQRSDLPDKEMENDESTLSTNKYESKSKDGYIKSRNDVKIFNAPTNWSHVKSRIFDNNENNLKVKPDIRRLSFKDDSKHDSNVSPVDYSYVKTRLYDTTATFRRKSKVGFEDDTNTTNLNDDTKKRNAVKIFNSSQDYSHIKSRLFDSSQINSDNLLKPSTNNRRKSKIGIDGEKESNDFTKGERVKMP